MGCRWAQARLERGEIQEVGKAKGAREMPMVVRSGEGLAEVH